MSLLSDLVEDVANLSPIIFSEGDIFRLDPFGPSSRGVPSFIFLKNKSKYVSSNQKEIGEFVEMIRGSVNRIFDSQLEKARAVSQALQNKYEFCKKRAQGLSADDVLVPDYKINLNEEIETKLKEFEKKTIVIYQDIMINMKENESENAVKMPIVKYSFTIYRLTPIGSMKGIIEDELKGKDLQLPNNIFHENDNLREKIVFYEFYLKNIYDKNDKEEFPIKIREVNDKVQVYVDIPYHIIEDVKFEGEDKPWYEFQPTQAWMELSLENGKIKTVTERALLPDDYIHPFGEPKEYLDIFGELGTSSVCIGSYGDAIENELIKEEDTPAFIKYVLKSSGKSMVYGYTERDECRPWRAFNNKEYAQQYEKLKVDKSKCNKEPDNRR